MSVLAVPGFGFGRRSRSALVALMLTVASCSDSETIDDVETTSTIEQTQETSPPGPVARDDSPTTSESEADPCTTLTAGATNFILGQDDSDYQVRLYVPTSFDGSPLPVVLNWHGLGSTGEGQAVLTGYEATARREGFMVVHPTGLPALGDDRNSWELTQFDAPERDDVAFASSLIDELTARYCVDPDRVYSTGMSNGGFFTARLVCELADRIAAAVSVAGTTHDDGCRPARPVPYLGFHGTADEVVRYGGGGSVLASGDDVAPATATFFDQVMPDEFSQFADDFGCDGSTTTELTAEITRTDYRGCDGDTPMIFYTVIGGGHTWPGSAVGVALESFLGKTTTDVDATSLGWEFLSQHTLD